LPNSFLVEIAKDGELLITFGRKSELRIDKVSVDELYEFLDQNRDLFKF